MALTFYYASGSPYAWRVWLALEHKRLAYTLKTLSFDAGDLKTPEFTALNPRQRVPVLDDEGFALYESAAIVDYIEDRWPQAPHLYSADLRQRAVQRRMVREADAYVAQPMEHLVEAVLFTPPERRSPEHIAAARDAMHQELARWEPMIAGDYLAGELSAADYTLYPYLALLLRIARRSGAYSAEGLIGPKLTAWCGRMEALPQTKATWPPHWK